MCSNLETNSLCLRLLILSLSLYLFVYILHSITCVYLYMHDILVCLIDILAWGLFANTRIQPREPTRHLNPFKGNLEELVQSPSRGIRLHSCVIRGVSVIVLFGP